MRARVSQMADNGSRRESGPGVSLRAQPAKNKLRKGYVGTLQRGSLHTCDNLPGILRGSDV